ncbi:LysE family transporter [Micromonospora sp. NPDC051925]|uniref:LysE family transporter n=1 Tax=Micromonospora sp. NPDC051925 TaxID=3364288 RepID=UPI0037C934C2
MPDEIVVLVIAGVAAGLGVAMPLGAIGVLIVREGMLRGYRSGLAAAAGVATVDTLYCLVALLTGAALAPVIASWGDAPRYLSGAVIIALGGYQLIALRRSPAVHRPEAAGPRSRSVYARFVALTAINPLTLVYFFALAGVVTTTTGTWFGPAVFVVAAGFASLLWQMALAAIGAVLGAAIPGRVADALGVAASVVVVALGVTVIVVTAST